MTFRALALRHLPIRLRRWRALKQRGRIPEWQCYKTIATTTAVQWKRHLSLNDFAIIQARPRRAKCAKYCVIAFIRTVLGVKIEKERFFVIGSRCRGNFSLLFCRLRQRTMLLKFKNACRICRTIVYPCLTNQIPVLWPCHCGCHLLKRANDITGCSRNPKKSTMNLEAMERSK